MIDLSSFPPLNASLNGASAALLVAGYAAIRARKIALHKALMGLAVLTSALFLACYVYYHLNKGAVTRFTTPGLPRIVYLAILIPHTILAVVNVPLVLKTLYHALRGQYERHRRIARFSLPIWLYVSVTGVLVYLMLYVWYPPAPPA